MLTSELAPQVILEIINDNGYWPVFFFGQEKYVLPRVNIGPNTEIKVGDAVYAIESLLRPLAEWGPSRGQSPDQIERFFDLNLQYALGHYLFDQTFSALDQRVLSLWLDQQIDLLIFSTDEHILRLPWMLLGERGGFLSNKGWSISISHQRARPPCWYPDAGRLLVLAPTPSHLPSTGAKAHLDRLRNALAEQNSVYSEKQQKDGSYLTVVSDLSQFKAALRSGCFDAIYYYGHGEGDYFSTKLLIGEEGVADQSVSAIDFANCLRSAEVKVKPKVLYVNCCYGNAGGHLGICSTLGHIVPAVVTNRTIVKISVAQQQAEIFWPPVLLGQMAPHDAIRRLRSELSPQNLTTNTIAWMNIVFFRAYSEWQLQSQSGEGFGESQLPPYWHLRLNRHKQVRATLRSLGVGDSPAQEVNSSAHAVKAVLQSTQAIRSEAGENGACYRPVATVWYAFRDNGLVVMAERLIYELRERAREAVVFDCRLSYWPPGINNLTSAFAEMIRRALDIPSINQLPKRIRDQSAAKHQQAVIAVFVHELDYRLEDTVLDAYIEWWNQRVGVLTHANIFPVIALAVPLEADESVLCSEVKSAYQRTGTEEPVVRKVARWAKRLVSGRGASVRKQMQFEPLGELSELTAGDLSNFIGKHLAADVKSPAVKDVVREIITRTHGRYDPTVREMSDIEDRLLAAMARRR